MLVMTKNDFKKIIYNNMVYLITQPRIIYYAWHLEVMLYQNQKIGMDLSQFHIVCGYSPDPNDLTNRPDVIQMYNKLQERFPEANFFHYLDDRNPITYIPSIVPHLLKKHFMINRWLVNEVVYLSDCDQIFIKKPDFDDLIADEFCHVSDSRGFLNYDYLTYDLRPKWITDDLEDIVGLERGKIQAENDNTGGSHYIMKNLTWQYFDKFEKDSLKIYEYLLNHNKTLEAMNIYPIQAWTAGMWSHIYNLWYFGKQTRISPKLKFCWGSDMVDKWVDKDTYIFHNAGVTSESAAQHNIFFKGHYTLSLPYEDCINTEFNKLFASAQYAKIIKEIGLSSCLL